MAHRARQTFAERTRLVATRSTLESLRMTQKHSVVFRLTIALAGCLLLAWACLFTVTLRARHNAKSLLVAVRAMEVNKTMVADVEPLLRRYHATIYTTKYDLQGHCASADMGYGIHIGNKTVSTLGLRFPFLRYFGLAPWGAGAVIFFEKGRVCSLNYGVAPETSGLGEDKKRFEMRIALISGKNEYNLYGHPRFGIRTIQIPSDATPMERSHAFAFNLACLTSFGGCRTVCQLLPLKPIWEDILARQQSELSTIPEEISQDPLCSAARQN